MPGTLPIPVTTGVNETSFDKHRKIGIFPAMSTDASPLAKAVTVAGSQQALANALGVKQSTLWYWLAKSKRGIPAEYVIKVEQATGVPRHELRPDLFAANHEAAE